MNNQFFLSFQTSISFTFVHLATSMMNNLAYMDNSGLVTYSPEEARGEVTSHAVQCLYFQSNVFASMISEITQYSNW